MRAYSLVLEKRLHFNDGWLTLNQRVQGSSPCAPTTSKNLIDESTA
jgi:hypothetical protein